jgi:hypothetical protein
MHVEWTTADAFGAMDLPGRQLHAGGVETALIQRGLLLKPFSSAKATLTLVFLQKPASTLSHIQHHRGRYVENNFSSHIWSPVGLVGGRCTGDRSSESRWIKKTHFRFESFRVLNSNVVGSCLAEVVDVSA